MSFAFVATPVPLWSDRRENVEIRFVGRGPGGGRAEVFDAVEPGCGLPVAWAKQIHSDQVLAAHPGGCGEGDALVTGDPGLVLSVVVADCVPVLLAGDRQLAAVHAGWRGLAADLIGTTLATLNEPAATLTAWIGPAIGPCCYEVSEEVAAVLVGASSGAVRCAGALGRPHLDLPAAAREQLLRRGVGDVRTLEVCTRCHPELLWSYRGQGPHAGRNHAFIWRG